MEGIGYKPNQWVYDMLAAGNKSFYRVENGVRQYYDIPSKSYKNIPGRDAFIILENLSNNIVWKNADSKITDIGDGVIDFSWHSKSYTLGSDVVTGLTTAIDMAEKNYRGLVIGHQGADFSLGANLGLVFMYAIEQDYDEIDFMVRAFQNAVMRIRYSSIPVIVAPARKNTRRWLRDDNACRHRAGGCGNIYRSCGSWCWLDTRWWRNEGIHQARERSRTGRRR